MNMFDKVDFVSYTMKYSSQPYIVKCTIGMYLVLIALDLDENRPHDDIW